ncbi:hypothetical protein LCG56_26895 [Pseudomonas cannabina pv. alisalensis]|uniref:Terminase n=1 Tax=Pseudomonas syringae pv. maculicola str. ES4326 TaxID=629265 RepID=A0A8T8BZQ9_PSEYM|nr:MULTISPECIES: hypothetical protein [Pseudomonas syringae group]QHE96855.1 hypothetical protein PMA4326_009615 [Pseudomonas syringae pv. maculicola str. ES4326]UBY97514.1 hypothetical protein LCG56_26895 [Pseudomonas cannabina pv. alisalensis]
MSADAMLSQLITNDELYCAKNLKIRTKEGQILPFVWNDAQRELHKRLEEQLSLTGWVRAIVLKGRQQGISTYVAARFYKRTSMNFGKRTMILTHLDAATQTLFGMAKTFFELSDDTLRPTTKANSGTELSFAKLRSGYKVATAGSPGAGRSDTIQFLHASEMAFWANAQKIMAGLGQTVPLIDDSEAIIESTANGMGNLFHQFWQLAVAGKSDYMAVFIPWFVESGYRRAVPKDFELSEEDYEYMEAYGLDEEQMAWRAGKISSDFANDVDFFNQEYPATPDLAFQKVGHKPLIKTVKVSLARKKEIKHERRIGAHVVGLDPARGGDTSTFIHRQGRVAWGIERNNIPDTMAVVGQAARMLMDDKTIRMMFIDIGGLGAGIYDRLVELGFGDRVTAVNFGSSASDSRKYANKRCEMWGEMAEWIHDDITPSIPDDDQLHSDLTSAAKDKYTSNGQLKLLPKEDAKKKIGRSPDDGDALALTFAEPVSADDEFKDDWRAQMMRRNSRRSAMSA